MHAWGSLVDMTSNRADEIVFEEDANLLADFITWTENAVSEMREISDEFPDKIERSSADVQRIYDLTHNIKGMGSSFNFELFTSVGVSLCGHLKGMDGDMLVSKRIFTSHIRAFEVVLQHKIKGNGGEQGLALIQRLEAIIHEESSLPS